MQLKQTLQVALLQKLSPMLIQTLKIYQSSYKDLAAQAQDLAQENVFLTVQAGDPYYGIQAGNSSTDEYEFKADLPNLRDHLIQQMKIEGWSSAHIQIGELLIEHLDVRGYLSNFPEVQQSIMKECAVSKRQVSLILEKFQALEPDGIGARNLKESLQIQLKNRDFEDARLQDLLLQLVGHHLEAIAAEEWQVIAEALDLEIEQIKLLANYVRDNCNPSPAASYQGSSVPEVFLTPSFEVEIDENKNLLIHYLEKEKGLQVAFNEAYYDQLMAQQKDPAAKAFVQTQYQKAKHFYDTFHKRQETLQKIAVKIIQFQKAFFIKGEDFLKPLQQKKIAAEFEYSAATISRLVKEKFVRFRGQIFPLRALCVRDHFGRSKSQLKAHLQHLFDLFPELSDQKIADMAKNQGIKIARRTVTKYRHEIEAEVENLDKDQSF